MAHPGPVCDEEMDQFLGDLLKALAEDEREVSGMADELAGKMADMTIGEQEDEIAEAQQTKHQQRDIEAQIREMKKLIKAEIRRLEFALDELDDKYD